ncbi:MAG: hypothetical protein QM765_20665 [Myxococcales bacterium]
MEIRPVDASFSQFELANTFTSQDATVCVPVSNGVQQRYFFMNMRTGKGLKIKYPSRNGLLSKEAFHYLEHLTTFAMNPNHFLFPRLRVALRKFHNGISFFEVLYKVLKPHGVTYIGNERFLISLWSASIYYVIDLKQKRIEMHMEDCDRREVFSTYQYFDDESGKTFYATQMGVDEFYKHDKEAIHFNVPVKIKTYDWKTDEIQEIWRGDFDTDTHYMQLNKDKRYLALMNFGDFYDEKHNVIPSKILVLDLKTKKEHWVDNQGWSPSGHVDWDPCDPETAFFSCHNGVIGPNKSPWTFLKKKQYHWNIYGPASVHKFRMTKTGMKRVGLFTHPQMERLTIHKVFMHRGQKLLACTGFPNNLFIADAEKMELIRHIKLTVPCGCGAPTSKPTVMGSMFPSPCGEKIYCSTAINEKGALQVVDVATGKTEFTHDIGTVWDPFNHMTVVGGSAW